MEKTTAGSYFKDKQQNVQTYLEGSNSKAGESQIAWFPSHTGINQD